MTTLDPLHVFRFRVDFNSETLGSGGPTGPAQVCTGAFAECTGLEATMEPKAIKEGGHNYGVAQRAGGISFATVVLKRGISVNRDLWKLFNSLAAGNFAARLQVIITLFDGSGTPLIGWQLDGALPVKFKFADFNAKSTEVGIEELHLVHEGLSSVPLAG